MPNSPYISKLPNPLGGSNSVYSSPNKLFSPDAQVPTQESELIRQDLRWQRQQLVNASTIWSQSKNKYLVQQHHHVKELSQKVQRSLLKIENNASLSTEQLLQQKLSIMESLGNAIAGHLFGFGDVVRFMMGEYQEIISSYSSILDQSMHLDDVKYSINRLKEDTTSHLNNLTRTVYSNESGMLEQNDNLNQEYGKLYENGRLFSLLNRAKLLKSRKSDLQGKIYQAKNTVKELEEGLSLSQKNFEKLKVLVSEHRNREEETKAMHVAYHQNMHRINELSAMIVPDDYHTQKEHHQSLLDLSSLLDNRLKSENELSRRNQFSVLSLADKIQGEIDVDSRLHDFKTNLHRAQTPRPKWETMKPIVDDVETRTLLANVQSFPDMDINESSASIVEKLRDYVLTSLHMIEDQRREIEAYEETIELLEPREVSYPKNEANFFMGLGETPDVPKYLRYTGELKNKKLSKRDLENTLEDIWRQRERQRKATGRDFKKGDFADFFESYLSTQFSNVVHIKREWSYSIIEGCKLFREDPDCDMFLTILEGNVSEETYSAQFSLINRLQQTLTRLDIKLNNLRSGVLKKSVIFKRLEKFFTTKSQKRLLQIKCMLHLQNAKPIIDYQALFEEDRNHSQGIFVESIREQFLKEIQEYNANLTDQLCYLVDEKGQVSLEDVKQAFFEVDPLKPTSEIVRHINMALQVPESTPIDWDLLVDNELFSKKLLFHLIKPRTNPDRVDRLKEQIRLKKSKKLSTLQPNEELIEKPVLTRMNSISSSLADSNKEPAVHSEYEISLDIPHSSSGTHLVPKLNFDFHRSKSTNTLLTPEQTLKKRDDVKRQLLRDQYKLEQQLSILSSDSPNSLILLSPASPESEAESIDEELTNLVPFKSGGVSARSDYTSSSLSSSSSLSDFSVDSELSVSSISPSELPSFKKLQGIKSKRRRKRRKKAPITRPSSNYSTLYSARRHGNPLSARSSKSPRK